MTLKTVELIVLGSQSNQFIVAWPAFENNKLRNHNYDVLVILRNSKIKKKMF